MNTLTEIKKIYMKKILNYTDPGYYILKNKANPLSTEQSQFVQIYQNTISLHSISISLTLVGFVMFVSLIRASRKQPPVPQKVNWARNRLLWFSPFVFATTATAYMYQKQNRFVQKLKQIQEFYQNNRDKDLNTISFPPPTLIIGPQ